MLSDDDSDYRGSPGLGKGSGNDHPYTRGYSTSSSSGTSIHGPTREHVPRYHAGYIQRPADSWSDGGTHSSSRSKDTPRSRHGSSSSYYTADSHHSTAIGMMLAPGVAIAIEILMRVL